MKLFFIFLISIEIIQFNDSSLAIIAVELFFIMPTLQSELVIVSSGD